MGIADQLQEDMKKAMKEKDKFRLSVIRMMRSEIKNREISQSESLSEDEAIELIAKEKKKRQDSLEEYQQAGKTDVVEDLKREIEILDEYLPEQLSQEELKKIIEEAISNVKAESPSDMGEVMKEVMPKVKGKADGKIVNQLVKELLTS
ncbi:GatB/YqeY domain-containing protein [Natranaerobius thermophilus]|uniref:GatB/YqeY domain protein n=1 Tax=Natranaerobius thermophilus (strain ATCC BAA-1301 / DSM 18059 / JW/NM-WN-LF) TaxID=457570 RepID=B2A1N8_NATTJ|nr:GatB/YqeY domain-containing protein [Natranaerobius thermophilus]ACB84775.1 GatB/YqeY domain protein [Natranaerobius thermophilus JW/NM-WN-LF]